MIAYLVMCHKNPEQVNRLAQHLITEDSDVFIHCDANMSDEDIKKIDKGELTSNRYRGILDDRSLVDIVFELIDTAKKKELKDNIHYKYYALLSGQDYIIKPIDFVNEELKKNYPRPYIDCTPYDENNWVYHKFKYNFDIIRYNRYISTLKKGIVRKVLRGTAVIAQRVIKTLKKTDYHYFASHRISLFGGSAWWILPDQIIDYILSQTGEDYAQKLLLTWTPEETYFQILAMRSPLKDMVHVNPIEQITQTCKTWAYFSDTDKSFKGHPYILTQKNMEQLINNDFWFARKFDEKIDCKIFDMLDEHNERGEQNVTFH